MDREPTAVSPAAPAADTRARSRGRKALAYAIAAACLIWVLYDIHPERFLADLRGIRWNWVTLTVVADVLSYVCQGLRWQLLLRPLGVISVREATEAIYVGLFANEILPLRVGELVRGYLVSRRMSRSLASVIPSLVVERFFDGVWLAVGIGVTAILIPLPRKLLEAGDVLGAVLLLAIGIFALAVFRRQRTATTSARSDAPPWKPLHRFTALLSRLAEGLRAIGTSRWFFLSFWLSLFFLLLQAAAFWLVMWGYGIHHSFWVGLAILLIVHLGTAIPNAPANVGTYQFFCVVGLALFSVEKTQATGFSVVVFVILTVPLWALGFWALTRTGTTLARLREEVRGLRI